MADRKTSESILEKIDFSPQFGWNQFLIHVREGNVSTVQTLISEGHSANDRNNYGLSALTVSVISRNERMVETILNAPDFNYRPTAQELIDPVSLACFIGLQNIVLILLNKLPYLVNNKTPYSGFTPIFFAGINRQFKIVEILLERGADLRVENSAQLTIMEVANVLSDAELVALLSAKSGIDDLNKPRCHPSLYTPPRCLGVKGVSPMSPKMTKSGLKRLKPYSKTAKTDFEKPVSTPKAATPLRPINRNILPDESFSSLNELFRPNSPSFSHSTSFYSESFTPIAKSSLLFNQSTLSESFSEDSSYSATPKLLSYTALPSPYLCRTGRSPSPKMPSLNCWYHHYPSPQYPQTPSNLQTPVVNPKFPHTPQRTPQNFQIPQINLQSPKSAFAKPQMNYLNITNSSGVSWSPQSCRRNFLTPQNAIPRQTPKKSFVEAFVTPMRSRMKKVSLRTKLLDKLYKREKLMKNDENQSPDEPDCADDLDEILEYLGLQKFQKFFEMNEVEPEMFRFFSDGDLKSMGIEDKKDRKLILGRIQKKLPGVF